MALKKSQRSLKAWGKQKWRTKSGKKSSVTGERYLPSAAIKALSPAEYAASTRAKRKAKRAANYAGGEQIGNKTSFTQPRKTLNAVE